MSKMRFGLNYDSPVFYDLETSGLDPAVNEIIQIGAYHPVTGDNFIYNVQFDISKASSEALEANHYDEKLWENAISQSEAAQRFKNFCQSHTTMVKMSKAKRPYSLAVLIGYNNSSFDRVFMDKLMWDSNLFSCYDYRQIDVFELAKWLLPYEAKYDLSSMVKYFGGEVNNAHNALADTHMTAFVAACLVEILAESSSYEMPQWVKSALANMDDKIPF